MALVDLCGESEQSQELVAALRGVYASAHSADAAAAWAQPLEQLAVAGNTLLLVESLCAAEKQKVFLTPKEPQDVERLFCALGVLLHKLDAESRDRCARDLMDQLKSNTSENANTRLGAMINVHNVLPLSSSTRREAFVVFVEYAAASGNAAAVAHLARKLMAEPMSHEFSAAQLRRLYGALKAILAALGDTSLAYQCELLLVETFAGTEDGAAAAAKEVIVSAISLPSVFQFDPLQRLPAVKALPQEDSVAKLLDMFAHSSLAQFEAYTTQHPDLLKSLSLDAALCLKKMRLLSLTSLGKQSTEVTYDAVAAALKIEAAQVEGWVITAIGCGLIDAKLDQQAKLVRISRATHRTFTPDDWKQLRAQLSAWSSSLTAMLPVLHTNVAAAAAAAAGGVQPH